MQSRFLLFLSVVGLLSLVGCSTTQTQYVHEYARPQIDTVAYANQGIVEDVRHVWHSQERHGRGALAGALIGGAVAGATIGSGSGAVAAAIGGAVIGGIIGDSVDRNRYHHHDNHGGHAPHVHDYPTPYGYDHYTRVPYQDITIRLWHGDRIRYRVPAHPTFNPGDRVSILGKGAQARIVHR